MKHLLFTAVLLFSIFSFLQVGVGTTLPAGSFTDVKDSRFNITLTNISIHIRDAGRTIRCIKN